MGRVQSLGEYADPTALVGEVKLEEGQYIKIERDDSHNSLIISDTRPAVRGLFSQHFSDTSQNNAPSLPHPILQVSVI